MRPPEVGRHLLAGYTRQAKARLHCPLFLPLPHPRRGPRATVREAKKLG